LKMTRLLETPAKMQKIRHFETTYSRHYDKWTNTK
jgi:hypothetical protein